MNISKKRYPIVLIITGLLLTLALPALNYISDPWRVFHKDYGHAYKGTGANLSYLKVAYLQEHPKKYDTLLFGSSRNFVINEAAISNKSYNMAYTFGVVGTHLHNLQTIIKTVKLKSIWIGINDFEIWKDPNDFYNDLQRRPYPLNFYELASFYKFYLLANIRHEQVDIISGKRPLQKSGRIIRDELVNNYKRAKLPPYSKKRAIKMNKMGALLLQYKDGNFRIDQTIKEIKEIKKLCDTHNIELKLFYYPIFYKTYIYYNQYKIEEFKRKLATVTGFYDFYELSPDAFNEMNWYDTGHFLQPLADKIIAEIKANKHYVDNNNIEEHLLSVRKEIINLAMKKFPIENFILRFSYDINLNALNKVFDISSKSVKLKANNQMQIKRTSQSTLLETKDDPYFIVDPIQIHSPNAILSFKIDSPRKTLFKIFYKTKATDNYGENHAFGVYMRSGEYKFNLLFPSKYLRYGLRIDPVSNAGSYKLKRLAIFGVK